ncbi:uncharacterized protein CG5098-like [Seriola lalandi dorsalis]|uniref:uncharacterized protein CG5098-like n=1 Tax=Seriola lalandi dorsalis TaxID=1841481 RepID=UPI000C6F89DD|nr:uncharacterized protein CG5098-like [Seriola lalandi dorsalis]
MCTGLQLASILLVCLLSGLDSSSAFPRARSVYPEAWQGIKEKQQGGYNSGNRRPLQYIQALRQAHRKLQPNVLDQLQAKSWQKPQESSLSYSQSQNQPGVYHETQNPKHPSLPQTPPQRNHPVTKPRSFEFSLKVPFISSLGQNKETSQTTKGSAGGSDGAGHYSQLYRPTSVQIHSSFNSPSGSNGSTNAGKNVHDVSRPIFQFSLSVPIPATTQSPKPSSSNSGYFTNIKRPGTSGFVQSSYTEPPKPQSSSTQSESEWILQQQMENQLYKPIHTKHSDSKSVNFSPGYASQPIEQISQSKIPTEQRQVFGKLVETPSLPIYHYPQQSDNVYSGYYTAQVNPTRADYGKRQSGQTGSYNPTNAHLALSPSQYERAPSGYHSAGQVKPSGNNYGQQQTWQPVATQPTFASDGHRQNVKTVSHSSPVYPSSPPIAPYQYELPSFSYNREIATNTDYATGNMAQMGPTHFSSSSHQYSRGQTAQDALSHTYHSASHSLPNFQDLSTQYQTQMRLPGQDTGRGQIKGNPSYTKLFVDVEDVTDGGHRQNHFAAPTTHYDGYSGQKMGETLIGNPKLQSLISVNQGQLSGVLSSTSETYPRKKPHSYIPISNQGPSMDGGVGYYASYPQKQMQTEQLQNFGSVLGQVNKAPHVGADAGSFPTNFGQEQMIYTMTDTFSLSNGYPVGQMQLQQPTSDQRTENYYAMSVDGVNPSNTYSQTQGLASSGGWAQMDHAAPEQMSNANFAPSVSTYQY